MSYSSVWTREPAATVAAMIGRIVTCCTLGPVSVGMKDEAVVPMCPRHNQGRERHGDAGVGGRTVERARAVAERDPTSGRPPNRGVAPNDRGDRVAARE